MKKNIFIIDDEPDMLKNASDLLTLDGFNVRTATDPEKGLEDIKKTPPDLLLLDIRMEPINGFEVCKLVKSDPKINDLPIIIVSTKTDEADVVTGLELGAEDYIQKPFRKAELLARIRTTLRRIQKEENPVQLKVGPLTIDPERYSASLNGEPLSLRPKEFELLYFFLRHEGQVLTHATISQKVWKVEHVPTSYTINFHVTQLRKKLGRYGKWLKSLKGIGYRFEVEEEFDPE